MSARSFLLFDTAMIAIALFLMHCAAWAGAWVSLWV